MNEILQQLARRKSVRAYEEVPVTAEEKRLILEAACQAPPPATSSFTPSSMSPASP